MKPFLAHIFFFLLLACPTVRAQNIELKSVGYNALIGSVSGGIGAMINKKPEEKLGKAFLRGFLTGVGGGLVVYCGKKINYQVGSSHELGYAWLSRFVFSAGNSIVENAAANIPAFSRWHYDVGFIRFEIATAKFKVTPRVMPFSLGATIFMAANGKLDLQKTLCSGTLTFVNPVIKYAPQFYASTPGNGFLFADSLTGDAFYLTYGHEMIHTFQFQELSGFNYFLKPIGDKWKAKSTRFDKISKWVYADFNYLLMLGNYFLIQGGYKNGYRHNFLEKEAEFLSTGLAPK